MSSRVLDLEKMKDMISRDPNTFKENYRSKFWKIVGQIKRENNPDEEEIRLASEIRDILYNIHLGPVLPISPNILFLNGIGLGFLGIATFFSIEALQTPLMITAWFLLAIFMLLYFRLISLHKRRLRILLFSILVGLTIILDLLFYFVNQDLLIFFHQFYAIAAIPCFYLNGRLLGGKIGGIGFDGISRDVFGLYTLKINYPSYLRAEPPKRQWIFLCGGLGTVIVGLISSAVILLRYDNPWFFFFPVILLFLEILDYMGLGGPLGGAEFNHLRRERKIVREWRTRNELNRT